LCEANQTSSRRGNVAHVADIVTGLIGIAGTLVGGAIQWVIGRGTKESDELRDLYAAWATAAHHVITTVETVRMDSEVFAAQNQMPTNAAVELLGEETGFWKSIDQARTAMEKARFRIAISDFNSRRVQVVKDQSERLAKLVPMASYDEIDAAKKELEGAVADRLRGTFQLRPLLED
jgi:hypothetical protein